MIRRNIALLASVAVTALSGCGANTSTSTLSPSPSASASASASEAPWTTIKDKSGISFAFSFPAIPQHPSDAPRGFTNYFDKLLTDPVEIAVWIFPRTPKDSAYLESDLMCRREFDTKEGNTHVLCTEPSLGRYGRYSGGTSTKTYLDYKHRWSTEVDTILITPRGVISVTTRVHRGIKPTAADLPLAQKYNTRIVNSVRSPQ